MQEEASATTLEGLAIVIEASMAHVGALENAFSGFFKHV